MAKTIPGPLALVTGRRWKHSWRLSNSTPLCIRGPTPTKPMPGQGHEPRQDRTSRSCRTARFVASAWKRCRRFSTKAVSFPAVEVTSFEKCHHRSKSRDTDLPLLSPCKVDSGKTKPGRRDNSREQTALSPPGLVSIDKLDSLCSVCSASPSARFEQDRASRYAAVVRSRSQAKGCHRLVFLAHGSSSAVVGSTGRGSGGDPTRSSCHLGDPSRVTRSTGTCPIQDPKTLVQGKTAAKSGRSTT